MAITEQIRKWRRKRIGSSDIAAILGVCPFNSAVDIYYQKVEGIDPVETDHMRAGNWLEPCIMQFASFFLNEVLNTHPRHCYRTKGRIWCANLDGFPEYDPRPKPWCVEGKHTGVISPGVPELYGDEGTDELPPNIIAQCQEQMFVCGFEYVMVAVLIGRRGFKMYRVVRDDEIIEMIEEEGTKFYKDHLIKKIPPEGRPSEFVLKRLRRVPDKVVPWGEDLAMKVAKYKQIGTLINRAKWVQSELKNELVHALGDAEAATMPGGRAVTFMEINASGYTVDPKTYRKFQVLKALPGRMTDGSRTDDSESDDDHADSGAGGNVGGDRPANRNGQEVPEGHQESPAAGNEHGDP